jgi:hypothetical protein
MADQESPDERESGYTYYYDSSLDEAHDDEGYVDEPDRPHASERLYDLRPTLLERLWWRSRGMVYAISFSIPLLMLGGLLFIGWATDSESSSPSASVSSSDVSAASGAWPSEVEFVSNTVPAMIRNTLSLAGMKQGYRFRGTVGQVWRITVEPEYDSALDPQITLYAPSGGMLAQQGGEIVITLPEKGTYRLLVESAQGGLTTGAYYLTLYEE